MIYLNTLLAEAKLKMNIPSDIKKIYKAFKKSGKQLYVVGGAVRDAILGSSPKDFDLATDAKPDEVMKIAKANGMKAIDVGGKSFGVVEVNGHEVATFRKDIGKGRRPSAVDYTDIKGDVMRRDLTINALFYDIGKGTIVDLVGGIKDLKKKQVRAVGEPTQRFDEDPLRKLRAIRFAGSVGGKMHKDTWNALKKNPDISGVSGERIRDEFIKGIKKAQSVPKYLKMIRKLGMFKQIFPGLSILYRDIKTNDYKIQIAYMLHTNGADKVRNVLKKMKYTNIEVNDIWLLIYMSRPAEVVKDLPSFKKLQGNSKLTTAQVREWAKLNSKHIIKLWNWKLSVSAKDAMDKGMKGKDIGDYIKNKEEELFISA
jgi:tRNA nucleotidyltransferase/poly(A) polymerase